MMRVWQQLLAVVVLYFFSISAWAVPGFISPDQEDFIGSTSVEFSWEAGGTDVTEWWLYVGTEEGDRTHFDSGSLGSDTSAVAYGIPIDGFDVWATLYYREDGVPGWSSVAFNWITDELVVSPPAFIDPLAGSVVDPFGVLFEWTSNNTPAEVWWIQIGSRPELGNFYNSGAIVDPVAGEGPEVFSHFGGFEPFPYPVTAYITLWYRVDGLWSNTSISTLASGVSGDEGPTSFELLTAIDDSDDALMSQEFSTSMPVLTVSDQGAPQQVEGWWVYVGQTVGGNEFFDSGAVDISQGESSDVDIQVNPQIAFPQDGSIVYFTIWFQINNVWFRQTYELATIGS